MNTQSIRALGKPPSNLSCLQCQQHKRKCDKQRPCQTCVRRGCECTAVSRPRLPRGRHSTKPVALIRREAQRQEGNSVRQSTVGRPTATSLGRVSDKGVMNNRDKISIQEISGISEILTELVSESDDTTARNENPSGSPRPLFMINTPFNTPGTSQKNIMPTLHSKAAIYVLLDVYSHRVDPLLKITHAPSLRTLILSETELSPAEAALKSAVCWSALCTLTSQECKDILSEEKESLLRSLRATTEGFLGRVQLSTTKSLIALQAFVLYLIGLRTNESWRPVWTLISLAIRIGQTQALDRTVEGPSQFHCEMRRRLWFSMAVLELQAGMDGGAFSASIGRMPLGQPPLHLDDCDISLTQRTRAGPKTCFSDMTFASMSHVALMYLRKLVYVPLDVDGNLMNTQKWSERYMLADQCEQIIRREYLSLCRGSDDFQIFTETVGEDMLLTVHLLARRPISRLLTSGPPPENDRNVLDLAMEIMDRRAAKFNRPAFANWRWFSWTKWYVLAVIVAELCADIPRGQFDRAWGMAEEEYQRYLRGATDGSIRVAMERLMLKARRCRLTSLRCFSREDCAAGCGQGEGQRSIGSGLSQTQPITTPTDDAIEGNDNFSSWFDWAAFMEDMEEFGQIGTFDDFM